jgi:hypothetical protein
MLGKVSIVLYGENKNVYIDKVFNDNELFTNKEQLQTILKDFLDHYDKFSIKENKEKQ